MVIAICYSYQLEQITGSPVINKTQRREEEMIRRESSPSPRKGLMANRNKFFHKSLAIVANKCVHF